jgi:hypothetical protein
VDNRHTSQRHAWLLRIAEAGEAPSLVAKVGRQKHIENADIIMLMMTGPKLEKKKKSCPPSSHTNPPRRNFHLFFV